MNTAMLLCAGYGSRMKEYTKNIPKPMLPINGRPLLEYTVRHLASQNITNIIMNLHYYPELIKDFFGDGSKFGVNIQYSYEEEALGTAGALRKAEKLFHGAENFLLLYGDVICSEDYTKLFKAHSQKEQAIGTIILHKRKKSNSVVEMNEEGKIIRFLERPDYEVKDKKQDWVNSGLYCFNRAIFSKLPPIGTFSDFPKNIFSTMVDEGCLYGFPLTAFRCAVDTPDRYLSVQKDINNNSIFKNLFE